jgi:LytS/YehU family sensor histidine kinase
VVFDADGDTEPDTPEKQTGKRQQHDRENTTLMKLMGIAAPTAFPKDIYSDPILTVWPTKIGDVVRNEIGQEQWGKYEQTVRKEHENYSRDMAKNSLFISYVVLEAWKHGLQSASMQALCGRIIDHVRGSASSVEPLAISAEAEPALVAQ